MGEEVIRLLFNSYLRGIVQWLYTSSPLGGANFEQACAAQLT